MPRATAVLVARVLDNPFSGRPGEWRDAARRLLDREFDAGSEARIEGDDLYGFLCARALAQAVLRDRNLSDTLGPGKLPERVVQRTRRPRATLLRWVAAALRCQRALGKLAGDSPSLREVRSAAWSASFGSSVTTAVALERVIREHDVLVTGETGTGKEAVAHAIALGTPGGLDGGPAPFSALNVAAIPETLVESELFGHVKGAFTGAGKTRVGHIRSVASGCLFLDEVGDLPSTAQSKLLRVMETDRVTPLGSDQSYDADVRYIAATHRDLGDMVRRGGFRADLYERLAGQVIRLPPLRERSEDIAPIGLRFVERYLAPGAPEWRRVRCFLESEEARSHRWPGNVRELQNCLRNVLLGIDPGVSEREPGQAGVQSGGAAPDSLPEGLAEARLPLAAVEGWYVDRVLEKSDGNYALAARVLGLDRSTVRRKSRASSISR